MLLLPPARHTVRNEYPVSRRYGIEDVIVPASDEITSVGRKCLRANVLFSDPLGPMRTRSVVSRRFAAIHCAQELYHRESTFENEFVALLQRHGISHDPRYVFASEYHR